MNRSRALGKTDLEVFPLCLGGNVFGWTIDDEEQSFEILDAYVAAGGNFIDTAQMYGESEVIIGRWMASRGNRGDLVLATKIGYVGFGIPGGLTAESIHSAVERCMERLGVDTIDVLYAHHDDPGTPMEETLDAFHGLAEVGTLRWLGASNYSAERLEAMMTVAAERGLTPFTVLQPHYNLLDRAFYEDALLAVARRHGLVCIPYWALAKGYLTGKYRPGTGAVDADFSKRADLLQVRDYDSPRSLQVLRVLDEIAAAHETTVAAVALAWTRDQETIGAPLASARTVAQLDDLLPMVDLELARDERDRLLEASSH